MPPRRPYIYSGTAVEVGNPEHRGLAAGICFAYDVKDAEWRALSRLREVRLPTTIGHKKQRRPGWTNHRVAVEELPLPITRKLINDVPLEFIAQALQVALGRPEDEELTKSAIEFKRALADIMLIKNRVTRPLDSWDRADMAYIAERRPGEEAILNEAGTDWETPAI